MLGKAQAPTVRPLNMSYFLCKSNITQAEIDAYIHAVQENNAAISRRASFSVQQVLDKLRNVFSQIHAPVGWGGYWDNFIDSNGENQLITAADYAMHHSTGFVVAIKPTWKQCVLLEDIINVLQRAGNLQPASWYQAAANAYSQAGNTAVVSGDNPWARKIKQSLMGAPTDTSELWGTDLYVAALAYNAYVNQNQLSAAVVSTAKVITDKGGTLPTVP
jgi:hypothetical protein